MKKTLKRFSYNKGFANKKTIVFTSIILISAILFGAVYFVLEKFFYNPDFFVCLDNTMEYKLSSLTKFDFDSFEDNGNAEMNISIPSENLSANISLERKNDSSKLVINTEGETLTTIQKYYVIATKDDTLSNGEYYGSSVLNFEEKINNSIFSPTSGSKYAFSQEKADKITTITDYLIGKENRSKYSVILKKLLKETISNSEIANTFDTETKTVTVLGEKRKYKIQSFILNKDNLAFLLEDFSDRLYNLSDDEAAAIDYYGKIGKDANILPKKFGADDVFCQSVASEFSSISQKLRGDDNLSFEYNVKLCYQEKFLSAIIIDYTYKNDAPLYSLDEINSIFPKDSELSGILTIDFGKNPTNNRKIIYNNKADGKLKGESYSGTELIYDAKKEKSQIVHSIIGNENSKKINISFTMNDLQNNASFLFEKEDTSLKYEFDFSDSSSEIKFKLRKVYFKGEEVNFPYRFDISFRDDSNIIRLGDYVRIFEMSENEYDEIYDDTQAAKEKWRDILNKWKLAHDKVKMSY